MDSDAFTILSLIIIPGKSFVNVDPRYVVEETINARLFVAVASSATLTASNEHKKEEKSLFQGEFHSSCSGSAYERAQG